MSLRHNCQDFTKFASPCCDNCQHGICPGCTYPNEIDCRRHAPEGDRKWPRVHRGDLCWDYQPATTREELIHELADLSTRVSEWAMRATIAEEGLRKLRAPGPEQD